MKKSSHDLKPRLSLVESQTKICSKARFGCLEWVWVVATSAIVLKASSQSQPSDFGLSTAADAGVTRKLLHAVSVFLISASGISNSSAYNEGITYAY